MRITNSQNGNSKKTEIQLFLKINYKNEIDSFINL